MKRVLIVVFLLSLFGCGGKIESTPWKAPDGCTYVITTRGWFGVAVTHSAACTNALHIPAVYQQYMIQANQPQPKEVKIGKRKMQLVPMNSGDK
jgi:hypothetical protein